MHVLQEALNEAHMEIEQISLEKKQLFQQWSSSLIGMRRRDEAHAAMLEALKSVHAAAPMPPRFSFIYYQSSFCIQSCDIVWTATSFCYLLMYHLVYVILKHICIFRDDVVASRR